jgi:hypothetical protein
MTRAPIGELRCQGSVTGAGSNWQSPQAVRTLYILGPLRFYQGLLEPVPTNPLINVGTSEIRVEGSSGGRA